MARRTSPKKRGASAGGDLFRGGVKSAPNAPPAEPPKGFLVGAGLLFFSAVGYGYLTWLARADAPNTSKAVPFVVAYAALFALFLFGLFWLRAQKISLRAQALALLLPAALFRLILLPAPPLLDDDIYRYRWDGKLVAHGVNPYAHPPAAAELERFRAGDALYEKVAFTDIPTVYPPLSQLLFAAGYALTPNSVLGIKILLILCDVGAIFALMGLLNALERSPAGAAFYAWNPLVLKEFANSGHHDSAGIALLAFGLWAMARNRTATMAVCFAAAALIKPIILLLAPAFWNRLRLRDALLLAGIFLGAWLPFAGVGVAKLLAGVRIYTLHWEMNSSLFALFQEMFGGPAPSPTPDFLYQTNPNARLLALACWGAAAVYLAYDGWREQRGAALPFGPAEGGAARTLWRMGVLLGVILLVTPTMDPWYLCWLLPILCVFPWYAWGLLTGTVALSYLYYWKEQDLWWLRPLEYGSFYLLLIHQAVTTYQRSKRRTK